MVIFKANIMSCLFKFIFYIYTKIILWAIIGLTEDRERKVDSIKIELFGVSVSANSITRYIYGR